MTIRSSPKAILFDEYYDEFEFQREIFAALKKRREKLGLSQRELAKRIGITQSVIGRLETGHINPTLDFLKKIILGLDLEVVFVEKKPQRRDII